MTTPAQLVCNHCRKPMNGYFKVERFNARGETTITTTVCSALCLAGWSQHYMVTAGTMGVMHAKSVVENLLEAVRGPKLGPKK